MMKFNDRETIIALTPLFLEGGAFCVAKVRWSSSKIFAVRKRALYIFCLEMEDKTKLASGDWSRTGLFRLVKSPLFFISKVSIFIFVPSCR